MQAQKIAYIILLLISATVSLQAQKFVNLENRWRMTLVNRGQTYAYLTFFKDSVEIGGKYYYQAYDSIANALTPSRYYYREQAGIVYLYTGFIDPNMPNEQVIYNFNMEVGDSIVYERYQPRVVKIDSVTLLNGSKRKRLELSSPRYRYNLYWVEGIGAIDIETLKPHIATLPHVSDFSCYFHKNELLYSNPYHEGNNGGLSCALKLADPVSTRDLQELKSLAVLQNLGDGELIYQLTESGRYQSKLYTATGALLEQKVLGQGTHRVSLTAFPRGMYFLRIMDTALRQQKTMKVVW